MLVAAGSSASPEDGSGRRVEFRAKAEAGLQIAPHQMIELRGLGDELLSRTRRLLGRFRERGSGLEKVGR